MKKAIATFMICFLWVLGLPLHAQNFENDMRAVWISTVYNLDYPSTKNNITAQQNEFNEKLDALKAIGINTVIVQVRPKADALYASSINPWSDVLTGTQGKNPGYDPLAFMIEAAHIRGMSLHAWLNPYRVTTSGTDLSTLSETHPARLNPSWTFSYNNALFYNPEVEGVKEHIVNTVKELVTNYDLDGIHFDDYFYPSNYPLPAGEGKDGPVANARREAVNDMVKRVSRTIKSINAAYSKSVSFGISPPGIWKNSKSDTTGSNTSGREAYYALYADSRTWIQNGWVDYIVPQIYWKIGYSIADYETLVKWWSNEVKGTKVKLYIGQGIYTDDVAKEIGNQLSINKKYTDVKGSIYFSLRDLLNNRQSCKTQITNFYTGTTGTIGNTNNTTGNTNNTTGNDTGTTTNGTGEMPNLGDSTNDGTPSIGANPFDPPIDSWVGQTTQDLSSHIGKIGTVNTASLNIRAGAKVERDIVTKATSGTKVTILSVLNNWYKVKLASGTVGWANSSYISVSNENVDQGSTVNKPNQSITSNQETAAYPFKGTVTASLLNIRSGAKVEREVVGKATSGNSVTVLSALGEWYKVKLADGTVGWASSAYITKAVAESATGSASPTSSNSFPKKAQVTASSLNIRSGARVDREVVATVTKGTALTLLASQGEWYKVKLTNGTVGWAVKAYIA